MTESRFSLYYREASPLAPDDRRMRVRLAAIISHYDESRHFAGEIERKLGVVIPYNGGYRWREYLEGASIADVMDIVTVVFAQLRGRSSQYRDVRENYLREALRFHRDVAEVLKEQNVSYTLNADGAVRLLVDEQFEASKSATLSALSGARYANVLSVLETALRHLNETSPNGKEAIRGVFNACEGLFRLHFPRAPRLAADQVRQKLLPALQSRYQLDPTAARSAQQLGQSFIHWVEAAHWYRHEQGTEEVNQPDVDLAIAVVATGLAFIRWLASANLVASATTMGPDSADN